LIEVFEDRVEEDENVDLEVIDYTIDYGEPRTSKTPAYLERRKRKVSFHSVGLHGKQIWTMRFIPQVVFSFNQ